MKDVQVTIQPTEIKSLSYNNNFTKKPGEKYQFQVKSNAAIRLNTTNPVAALVVVAVVVEDPDECIAINVETITGITVSTFIDDLEGFIRDKYLPVVLMAAHEKIRTITTMMGMPIRIPNPVFGQPLVKMEGFTQ